MRGYLLLGTVLFVSASVAAAADYKVTILRPDQVLSRPEYRASAELVGKSIVEIFGPLSEVRLEQIGADSTAAGGDAQTVEETIRGLIDRSSCLGRESEVGWHKALWVRGHILLKNGRILPIEILRSGIIIGDLLFATPAPTAGNWPPQRDRFRGYRTIESCRSTTQGSFHPHVDKPCYS